MRSQRFALFNWEKWPFNVVYFPLSLVWLYHIIRSRAVWFFTPSNPTITFGGLEGEPKKEMYEQLPDHLYPPTFNVLPHETFESIEQRLTGHGISYPFVVKPELGSAGLLFRKIDRRDQLEEYHQKVGIEYIVQGLILHPMEVSVFYYRMPKEASGTITGFLHKVPMFVRGDGNSTLLQLIQAHPKAAGRMEEMTRAHAGNFSMVIPAGERYPLSHAANHNRGAQFINLAHEIDDRLLQVFDDLSHKVNGWYYGRYDIMCAGVEQLKQGKEFQILEYNGCGAEPNHIYDSGYTLWAAYREILKHWDALYRISRYNATHGHPYWSFKRGWRLLRESKQHFRRLRSLDASLSF